MLEMAYVTKASPPPRARQLTPPRRLRTDEDHVTITKR